MKRIILIFSIILFLNSCKKEIGEFEKMEIEEKRKIDSIENEISHFSDPYDKISSYKEILEINSENESALGNLGVIYYDTGDYVKSVFYNTKLIELSEKNPKIMHKAHTYLIRGKAKFELNDFNGTISDMLKSLESSKDGYRDNYVYLAHSYLKLEDYNNSCKYFSIAGEKGYSEAYDYISKYCN